MLNNLRIALAVAFVALAAVSAVDSASAQDVNPGTPRVVGSAYVNATVYDEDKDGMGDESQDPDLGLPDLEWGGP
jgi:hypothetical protein